MVFKYPKDMSQDYIKRVIGVPGDKITYENKRLTVNGKPVQYTRWTTTWTTSSRSTTSSSWKSCRTITPHPEHGEPAALVQPERRRQLPASRGLRLFLR
jgi:signal peptidase I